MREDGVQELAPRQWRPFRGILWGVFLILLGGVFLLERMGVAVPSLGTLWPAVFGFIAASQLLQGRPGAAVSSALMGVWFFACTFTWYGLTYRNSWGLILVALGTGTVIRALSHEDERILRRFIHRRGGRAS